MCVLCVWYGGGVGVECVVCVVCVGCVWCVWCVCGVCGVCGVCVVCVCGVSGACICRVCFSCFLRRVSRLRVDGVALLGSVGRVWGMMWVYLVLCQLSPYHRGACD